MGGGVFQNPHPPNLLSVNKINRTQRIHGNATLLATSFSTPPKDIPLDQILILTMYSTVFTFYVFFLFFYFFIFLFFYFFIFLFFYFHDGGVGGGECCYHCWSFSCSLMYCTVNFVKAPYHQN